MELLQKKRSLTEEPPKLDEQETHGVPSWHALSADEVLAAQSSNSSGLSDSEVAQRLTRFGPNLLPAPKRRSAVLRFLAQFHNVLIYVLLAATAITTLLDHWVDALVILGVVLINAVIGFLQEGKAEKALDAIREMLAPTASVIRDGQRATLAAQDVVPGDVVVLEAGDRVPADLRLFDTRGLRVEEAVLTGESMAVAKVVEPVEESVPLGDRVSMAFSGTLVTYGQGKGVVVATGTETEIGRISGMLTQVTTLQTPLLTQMAVFAKWLTAGILGLATLVLVFGLLVRDYSFPDIFMAVVGLSVAAIPEGLPAILTITLAIGVEAMARRNAIVRRLPAIETLGSVSVICSDKTGTLTRNEMAVVSIAADGWFFSVEGVGYTPRGDFLLAGDKIAACAYPLLEEICQAGVLCNDASLELKEGDWRIGGDPMEAALLVVACKAGLDLSAEQRNWPRSDAIPFDSRHCFMASLNRDESGHGRILVKGAPERVIEMCARQRGRNGEGPLDKGYWRARAEEIAALGQRVLAVAAKDNVDPQKELTFNEVAQGLTFLGLFGLMDPPRDEAIASVAACRAAGIRVKMITGDHAGTASAIARQLGLENPGTVLTGRDLDRLDDEQLRISVQDTAVFARTSPAHKLRLVEALQAAGEVVAMTGDGVNDAPALKRADVGIAMGQKGSEAAKEASEVVLADDNFATIAQAVRAGRTVYDNLKKAVLFILPTNGGEALVLIVAILIGSTLPITAVQILWVNMVTAVTLALALAFEPSEPDIMARPPRVANEPILSRFLIWRTCFVSLLFMIAIFGGFSFAKHRGATLEEARTIAVNMLVVLEIFYLFSVRHLTAPSLTWQGLLGTRAVLIAVFTVIGLQFAFTYMPFMQMLFETRSLGLLQGLLIVASGVLVLVVLEVEKLLYRRLALHSQW